MKKINKRVTMALSILTLAAVSTGAYAYFTYGKKVVATAQTETMDVKVTKTKFTDTENMIPGDQNDYSIAIENLGSRDIRLITEIKVTSPVELSDTLEWYVHDETVTDAVILEEGTIEGGGNLTTNKGVDQFTAGKAEFYSISDGKELTFLVNSGKLAGSVATEANKSLKKATDVDFVLDMAKTAGNELQGQTCDVTATVYAIQAEYTDDVSWETLRDSAEVVGTETA